MKKVPPLFCLFLFLLQPQYKDGMMLSRYSICDQNIGAMLL